MSLNNNRRVLAIGLDAVEPELIRRLIDNDQLPALKSLAESGKWLRVLSPAHIGSGCVWPTFASGEDPLSHGVYGEWCWQAETMSLQHYAGGDFEPFWKTLSENGVSLGILDAPFVKPIGLQNGFEIVDWGSHDSLGLGMTVQPAPIAKLVKQFQPHPLSINRHDQASTNNPRELQAMRDAFLCGVQMRGRLALQLLSETRPDFALIVFPEVHHCAHHLWPTTQIAPAVDVLEDGKIVAPALEKLLREVDRQIANLIAGMGDDDAVIVFSLHGMRSAAGVPWFLHELLCEQGFAALSNWRQQSSRDRVRSVLERVKRRAPERAKKLYYRIASRGAMTRLAAPNMLPVYDWSRTRAFSLPSDQHGWIRINLQDRERDGIVPLQEYEDTCAEVESFLRRQQRTDGRPLVDEVIRTARNSAEALLSRLPDLVVHWSAAAFANGASIEASSVQIKTVSQKFTGQHAPDGFCILTAPPNLFEAQSLQAKDISHLITRLLLWSPVEGTSQ